MLNVLRLSRFAIAAAAAIFPGWLIAQTTFVYTNNDISGPNTVSAFSVAANGALTPIPGSPFATGGTGAGGGLYAANRVTTSVAGNFLYAANDGVTPTVSAFSINPATGALTLIPGSPFNVGVAVSLATTPDKQFLIAASNSSAPIFVFAIAADGSLAPVAGSPFSGTAVGLDGIKITPNGQFLVGASFGSDQVEVLSIGPGGVLTPVPGSPFAANSPAVAGGVAGADINCQNNLLFSGVATLGNTVVDVFSLAANGTLTPIAGSPFTPGVGINSNVVLLSPNGRFLFVSNQNSNTVTVFNVASNGNLTLVPGSPFALPGSVEPAGMATDSAGSFLFVASRTNQIYALNIAVNGVLSPVAGSPFALGAPAQELRSLTAFPARTCSANDAYQVSYVSNLVVGDSNLNLTNTGTLNGFDPDGRICANVYTFDSSEEMVSCCSCVVTPDGLKSLSAKEDLLINTLTPGVPGSIVIKLLASKNDSGTACNAGAVTTASLAGGMRAWATTLHQNTATGTYQETENVFQTSQLSDSELQKLTTYCGFIQSNGSGFGICKSCRLGGLGGTRQ